MPAAPRRGRWQVEPGRQPARRRRCHHRPRSAGSRCPNRRRDRGPTSRRRSNRGAGRGRGDRAPGDSLRKRPGCPIRERNGRRGHRPFPPSRTHTRRRESRPARAPTCGKASGRYTRRRMDWPGLPPGTSTFSMRMPAATFCPPNRRDIQRASLRFLRWMPEARKAFEQRAQLGVNGGQVFWHGMKFLSYDYMLESVCGSGWR